MIAVVGGGRECETFDRGCLLDRGTAKADYKEGEVVEERKREGGRNARTRNRNWRLAESARVIGRKGDVSRLGA